MGIILKYIFVNAVEHKARTLVMMLSILLSTVLLFVSLSISRSYEVAQEKMARGMAGEATLQVQAISGNIQLSDIPKLSSIEAKVGFLMTSSIYKEEGYYESIDLIGVDFQSLSEINEPVLQNGKEIVGFTGYEIILPDRFTSKYKIAQGDMVTLYISGIPTKFKVAEIAAYDTVFLRQTRGATGLIPVETLKHILGEKQGYHKILIKPNEEVLTKSLVTELKAKLPKERFQVSQIIDEAQITAQARQKAMPFFLITFFSLTMGVFIIYSSYKVITLDRLPVIGTFRSIGATEKKVNHILILESLFYGLVSGGVGIPIGIIALKIILQGMGKSLAQGMKLPVIISTSAVVLSWSLAVIISLASAWFPMRSASRLPIKEVVLGNVKEKQISRPKIMILGAMMFIASSILPRVVQGNMLYIAGGLSLLGYIVSAILVIPVLTNFISRGLEHFYAIVFGNEGWLAARNMRDNKHITQNITLLFISISAIIAISIVGNFVTTYITDVFRGAQLRGFADGQMTPQFIEKVEELEGIETVLPLYVFKESVKGDGMTFSRLEGTDDLKTYNAMLGLHYTNEGIRQRAEKAFNENKQVIILSERCLERTGFKVGDSIQLVNAYGENTYCVVGSFKSRATDVEGIIPASYAVSHLGATNYDFLAYTAADPEAIMIQLRDLFGNTPNWSRTIEEFNTDAILTVSTFLAPMHSMTYFILLLAAIGVMNNLLINYMQRRHTIAMYKSIGLSHCQNIKITLIENFTTGLIGAVIAIFIAYMEIQTIFIVAGPKIDIVPQIEIKTFLVAGILGMLVTLLGAILPIFKAKHMKLVEEIKFE